MDGSSYSGTGPGGTGYGTGGYGADPSWQSPGNGGSGSSLPPAALAGIGVIVVLVAAIGFVLVTGNDSGDDGGDTDVDLATGGPGDGGLSEAEREAVDLNSLLVNSGDLEGGFVGEPPLPPADPSDMQAGPECADMIQILSRQHTEEGTPDPDAEARFVNEGASLSLDHTLFWLDEDSLTLTEWRDAAASCGQVTFVGAGVDGDDITVPMDPVDIDPLGTRYQAVAFEHQFPDGESAHQIIIRWERSGLRSQLSYYSFTTADRGAAEVQQDAEQVAAAVDQRMEAALGG
jgi:hypothetical protein